MSSESYSAIESKIIECSEGTLSNFDEQIILTTEKRVVDKVRLFVTTSQKFRGMSFLIGLLQPTERNTAVDELDYNKLLSIISETKFDDSNDLAKRLRQVVDIPVAGESTVQKQKSKTLLSKRECEVLKLCCQGLPTKIIADELSISDRTVEKHRANLMEKTGSKNIAEVIAFALKHELIEL